MGKATVEVWRDDRDGWYASVPWNFAVTYRGVRHAFAGMPNRCRTRRQASARARWRARWLEQGTFDQHYK